jgi:hypothetical protein
MLTPSYLAQHLVWGPANLPRLGVLEVTTFLLLHNVLSSVHDFVTLHVKSFSLRLVPPRVWRSLDVGSLFS